MILTYSGRSRRGAEAIAEASDMEISLNRGYNGDVNWGRNLANTKLNPDISNCTNKRVMRELFRLKDVPMPKLYTLHEAHNMALEGKTMVGRPDHHLQGRGFWIVKDNASFMRALKGTRRKRAATHFMDFVEADREYRVHIFKGKSIRISEKIWTGEIHPKTRRKFYTTGRPQNRTKHVRQAAKQAVQALGLDFGAVDILATNDECWVLEVNAAPGLGGSMPKLYADTFLRWERGE